MKKNICIFILNDFSQIKVDNSYSASEYRQFIFLYIYVIVIRLPHTCIW